MKKTLLLTLMLCCVITIHAQTKFKFGNVSKDLVEKTMYQEYPDAPAVVVYEDSKVRYDYLDGRFKVVRDYTVMLKILTQEGTEKANFEILTNRIPTFGTTLEEKVMNLDGYVFNMVGGKVQKTKLDRKYIFNEELSKTTNRSKITLPGVVAGSVVQFKYSLYSDLYYYVPDWQVQRDIPVIYSIAYLSLPEYFKFNIQSKGYETLDFKEKKGSWFVPQLEGLNATTRDITIVAQNVPSIKDDKHVFCVNDYTTSVSFELSGIDIPGIPMYNYSTTWENIEKSLLDADGFGKWLKYKNPFPTEVAEIVTSTRNKEEQLVRIYDLLSQKMTWNGQYRLFADELKESLKKGAGSNAQFNFILMSMLKDAGFSVTPVLVNPRHLGRFPLGAPQMDKIRSFVVAVAFDKNMIVLDGSSTVLGDYNFLPSMLQTEQAWFMGIETGLKGYMGRLNTINSSAIANYDVKFDKNLRLNVVENITYTKYDAIKYKLSMAKEKNKADFLKSIETKHAIKIDSFDVTGLQRPGHEIKSKMTYSYAPRIEGDRIYFNPLILNTITENPFTDENRKLPIEFEYPFFYKNTATITIPEGYEIEDIPEGGILSYRKVKLIFSLLKTEENTISVSYYFVLGETLFPYTMYAEIKNIWENMIKLNNQYVVLKKVKN